MSRWPGGAAELFVAAARPTDVPMSAAPRESVAQPPLRRYGSWVPKLGPSLRAGRKCFDSDDA